MDDDEFIIDHYELETDNIIITHNEGNIDVIITPNDIILEGASISTLKEALRKRGWRLFRQTDYLGHLIGKNGKRYYGWLKHKWGDYFDLYIKNPDLKVLISVHGPCFIPWRPGWYIVHFEINNVPALTLIRETEDVLNKWG